jgi:hypothetical protein
VVLIVIDIVAIAIYKGERAGIKLGLCLGIILSTIAFMLCGGAK